MDMRDRLPQENSAGGRVEPYTARWVDAEDASEVKRFIDKNQGDLAYDHDDLPVFLARNPWHLQNASETWPDIRLLKTREQTGQ